MNFTLDQYLSGLEHSAANLPSLVERWDSIDADLQEEYTEQLDWMLDVVPEVLNRAKDEGRYEEVLRRTCTALIELIDARIQLYH